MSSRWPTIRLLEWSSPEKGGGATKNYNITLSIDLIFTVYVLMFTLSVC